MDRRLHDFNTSVPSLIGAAIVAGLVLLVLDAGWIMTVAAPLFREALGSGLAPTPRLLPALAFYALYPIGLTVLAIRPALQSGRLSSALMLGAVAGALAYGTFDLTNLALLDAYTARLALSDGAWGTVLSAAAASAGFLVARRLGGAGSRG